MRKRLVCGRVDTEGLIVSNIIFDNLLAIL